MVLSGMRLIAGLHRGEHLLDNNRPTDKGKKARAIRAARSSGESIKRHHGVYSDDMYAMRWGRVGGENVAFGERLLGDHRLADVVRDVRRTGEVQHQGSPPTSAGQSSLGDGRNSLSGVDIEEGGAMEGCGARGIVGGNGVTLGRLLGDDRLACEESKDGHVSSTRIRASLRQASTYPAI
ncbi:hypothetical protein C8R44DRAFT_754953 [Mycena epipterygia]|nr:hypothetical protein C8R44DRAFT_754953 [Mycena epipterygia]